MRCDSVYEIISLYIDGQLNKEEEQFIRHINTCEDCRREFSEISEVSGALSNLPLLDLPEGVHESIMDKVKIIVEGEGFPKDEQAKAPARTFAGRLSGLSWKKYSAIAAGVVVVIVGVSVISGSFRGGSSKSKFSLEGSPDTGGGMVYETAPAENFGYTARSTAEKEIAYDAGEMYSGQTAAAPEEAGFTAETPQAAVSDRMIIKNMYISVDVRDFDGSVAALRSAAESAGGYVQYYNVYVYRNDPAQGISLRQGDVTLRVPQEAYESSKSAITALGKVTSETENSSDITGEYLDTDGKLKMKRVEEERLLTILEKSETVEDIIKVEERLSAVRSEIESYTTSLNNWDKLVEFSTITVNVTERSDSELAGVSSGFGTEIRDGLVRAVNSFTSGIMSFIIALAENFIIIVIAAAVVVVIVKKVRRKKQTKGENNNEIDS